MKPTRKPLAFSGLRGPRWPLAHQLAVGGCPIGCYVWEHWQGGKTYVLSLEADGVLCCLLTCDDVVTAVKWAIERHLFVCSGLGELIGRLQDGKACGYLPGRIVEIPERGSPFMPEAPSWVGPIDGPGWMAFDGDVDTLLRFADAEG